MKYLYKDMSDNYHSLRATLTKLGETGERVRIYGNGMVILAEGLIANIGDDIVCIQHHRKEEPDEFLRLDCIVKVSILEESRQY